MGTMRLNTEGTWTADRVIGVSAVTLAAAAALCMVLPVPWKMRFAVVVVAGLLGPAVPGLRLLIRIDVLTSLVIGVGVDVALLMVMGQAMLLTHAWLPILAFALLLVATCAAGVGLLVRDRSTEGPA